MHCELVLLRHSAATGRLYPLASIASLSRQCMLAHDVAATDAAPIATAAVVDADLFYVFVFWCASDRNQDKSDENK